MRQYDPRLWTKSKNPVNTPPQNHNTVNYVWIGIYQHKICILCICSFNFSCLLCSFFLHDITSISKFDYVVFGFLIKFHLFLHSTFYTICSHHRAISPFPYFNPSFIILCVLRVMMIKSKNSHMLSVCSVSELLFQPFHSTAIGVSVFSQVI